MRSFRSDERQTSVQHLAAVMGADYIATKTRAARAYSTTKMRRSLPSCPFSAVEGSHRRRCLVDRGPSLTQSRPTEHFHCSAIVSEFVAGHSLGTTVGAANG